MNMNSHMLSVVYTGFCCTIELVYVCGKAV